MMWVGRGACNWRKGRRLLPDVCGHPVLRIASVDMCSEGDVPCLPSQRH